MNKNVKSVADGMMEIMAILGEAPMAKKEKVIVAPAVAGTPVKVVMDKAPVQETVYEHGAIVAVNGKSVAKGPGKRKGGAKGPKNDPVKEALKAAYEAKVIALAPEAFQHSTEGLVVREAEADYSFKVTKAKEAKNDPTSEDFEVDKDFTVRGKAKNSAPKYAKIILTALEKSDVKFTLISARASGIVVHVDGGEFTIKISKKRDRVGFEAEKGAAYDK